MVTKVKICGLTTIRDIMSVNEHKPDYAGFVFAESKRRVDLNNAYRMISVLDTDISSCGVFVDSDPVFVAKASKELGLRVIQLHGNENNTYINMIKNLTGAEIWKAGYFPDKNKIDADRLLLDSRKPGSGFSFDWNRLQSYSDIMDTVIIAGGLDHYNIKELLKRYRPFCVDVSSGVEKEGHKDSELIGLFINNVKGV